MRISAHGAEVFEDLGGFKFIHDWYSMSLVLGTQPHALSYIKRDRHLHTRRLRIKNTRTVYQSSPTLQDVQGRIKVALEPLYQNLAYEQGIIAYREGINAYEVLKEKAENCSCIMRFDIRGYFDHIRKWHIRDILMEYAGMSRGGANLLAFYTLEGMGLQQGSVCSAVISNLVGHKFIDVPINNFLEERGVDVEYLRYCDNIIVVFKGNEPEGFYTEYKEFVAKTLGDVGLRTHKWGRVASNNPKQRIEFLGATLNASMKIARPKFDILRAEFFNMARSTDLRTAIYNKSREYGTRVTDYVPIEMVWAKVASVLRGKLNHVRNLNKKQGLVLQKLYYAIEMRVTKGAFNMSSPMSPLFSQIKLYRNNEEPIEVYMQRVESTV